MKYTDGSDEYEKAYLRFNKASQDFSIVRDAFRNRSCTAECFLSARREFDEAHKQFDLAEQKEKYGKGLNYE